MNNIKRKEIDQKVIQEIRTNEPEGFNQIKRSINKEPRVISLSLKRLTRKPSLIIKNSKGLYCLSAQTRNKLEMGTELDLPSYKRVGQSNETKQKISNTVKQRWKKRKAKDAEEEDNRITFLILRLAACGVSFTGYIPSQFKRADLLPPFAWYSPDIETVPGVAVEDFFVGDRRDFATGTLKSLDFEKTKITTVISTLVTKSILKPISEYHNIECITTQEKQRYEIVDLLLKEFIRDIQRLLYYILVYWIKETWQYRRPKSEEWKWYKDTNSGKSYNLAHTYTSAIRDTLYNRQQDEKIQRFLSNHLIKKDKQYIIEHLQSRRKTIAKTINKKWELIEDKYYTLKINNIQIYKLMTEKAYPDFMRKYVSQY